MKFKRRVITEKKAYNTLPLFFTLQTAIIRFRFSVTSRLALLHTVDSGLAIGRSLFKKYLKVSNDVLSPIIIKPNTFEQPSEVKSIVPVAGTCFYSGCGCIMSLMKQQCRNPPTQFYKRDKKLYTSLIDQHVWVSCFYENMSFFLRNILTGVFVTQLSSNAALSV